MISCYGTNPNILNEEEAMTMCLFLGETMELGFQWTSGYYELLIGILS